MPLLWIFLSAGKFFDFVRADRSRSVAMVLVASNLKIRRCQAGDKAFTSAARERVGPQQYSQRLDTVPDPEVLKSCFFGLPE